MILKIKVLVIGNKKSSLWEKTVINTIEKFYIAIRKIIMNNKLKKVLVIRNKSS